MALRYYERRDGANPPVIKLWKDPREWNEADLQAEVDHHEEILSLSDDALSIIVQALGGIGSLGNTLDDFKVALQDKVDANKDLIDYFSYAKTSVEIPIAAGDWYTPEAVELRCGEESGYEAELAVDGDAGTLWVHQADEEHDLVFRLRGYPKRATKIRIRRDASPDSELTGLDVYAATTLGGLSNPLTLAATNTTLPLPTEWNEVEFDHPRRLKFLRLAGFGSVHPTNQVRIRELQVWVTTQDYE